MGSGKDAFEDRRILVVGGAGFVGSNLVRALLCSAPNKLLVVDNLLSSEPENLPDDSAVTFLEGSINDDRTLDSLPRDLDYVFHLATYHGNQSSMADPLADHEHNTLTTLKLCEALKDKRSLRKVVYASAGCTVAEKTFEGAEATLEDSPVSLWLDSPYQISKIVGELYLNYYSSRFGLPAVKARFQNVYGPGEILGAGRWRGTVNTVWRNVTPTFVYKALKGEALPVENGGIATRDLIFVEDMAEGLIACADRGRPGEIYNLASGREISIRELAELINELTGNETPIVLKPARDWDHSGQRYGSTEKARRELGFEAGTPLRAGLERTIDWTRENLELIDRCIAKHADRMPELAGASRA
jgi:UDP-glucose 4-epimerase